jgi:ABC-2 type transport system permease protein
MSAAQAILAKDTRELVRDGRALATIGLAVLLALAALWLSAQRLQASESARTEAAARDRQTWLSQAAANPHSVAHFSFYAFKPQTALSLFDPGVSPYLGEAIWLEAHYQNPANFRPAEDATEARRFADLSPAWIVAAALPLVVIALGFASLAREREQGLWRQLAASGVASTAVLRGKAAWLFGLAAGLAALVTLPSIVAAAGLPAPADASARWLLIALAVVLYAAAVVGVTLAASASARTTRGALLALLGFWMLSVVLVPRLAATAADALAPVPRAAAFWAEVRGDLDKGLNGHDSRDARRKLLEAETLRQYGVTRVEDLPVSFAGIALQASEEHGNRIFDHHFGRLQAAYERQQRVMRIAGLLSPAVAFRNASAAFAGTDAVHHWHFAREAELHRRAAVKLLNDDMTRNARGLDFEYKAPRELWATVPEFRYATPGWRVARRAVLDLVILGAWALAGAIAATLAVRRWRAA